MDEADEEGLVQRWNLIISRQDNASDPVIAQTLVDQKTQWFSDAWRFLSDGSGGVRDHWWCQHTAVAEGVSELLAYYHQRNAAVLEVCSHMDKQLSTCFACINEYHRFQTSGLFIATTHPLPARTKCRQWYDSPGTLLSVMAGLDAERVERGLALVDALPEGGEQQPPATQLLCALYEALSFPSLLDDAGVMDVAARAACTLRRRGYDLSESGRFTGIYKLLAHADQSTRAEMHAVVRELGPLATWEEAEACRMDMVLAGWLHGVSPGAASAAGATEPCLGRGRRRTEQPREAVWAAIKTVLQLMQEPALRGAVQQLHMLLPRVQEAACPGGGVRSPTIQKNALACLRVLLSGLGQEVWRAQGLPSSQLVDCLTRTVQRADRPDLISELLHTIKALMMALLSASQRLDAEACLLLDFLHNQVYMNTWQHGLSETSRTTAALDSFFAVQVALRHGYSSGFACHVWGLPACQAVTSLGHASGSSEAKLQEGAAGLLCAVMRVDATVLGCQLEPWRLQQGKRHEKLPLRLCAAVPGCDDEQLELGCDVALDNIDNFRCSPAYYRWLGSHVIGNRQVAAAVLAAAAHLSGVVAAVVQQQQQQQGTPHSTATSSGGQAARASPASGGFFRAIALPGEAARPAASPSAGTDAAAAPTGRSAWRSALGQLPLEVERVLSWQAWVQDWEEQTLVAAQHPHLMLLLIRQAAEELLHSAAGAKHLLGAAAAYLAPSPQQQQQQPQQQAADLVRSALHSALRLLLGAEPRLSAAAAAALVAQMEQADVAGMVEMLLQVPQLLAQLLTAFEEGVAEVEARGLQQALSHPQLHQILRSFYQVLQAAEGADMAGAIDSSSGSSGDGSGLLLLRQRLVTPLVHLMVKLLGLARQQLQQQGRQLVLRHGRSPAPAAGGSSSGMEAGLDVVFQALPAAICFDVFCAQQQQQQEEEGQQQGHDSSAEQLHKVLPELLLLGPSCPPAVITPWLEAVELLVELGRVLGELPEPCLSAAAAVMAPGSGLGELQRQRLAAALPQQAPGNMALMAAPLAGLPSRQEQQQQQQHGRSVSVDTALPKTPVSGPSKQLQQADIRAAFGLPSPKAQQHAAAAAAVGRATPVDAPIIDLTQDDDGAGQSTMHYAADADVVFVRAGRSTGGHGGTAAAAAAARKPFPELSLSLSSSSPEEEEEEEEDVGGADSHDEALDRDLDMALQAALLAQAPERTSAARPAVPKTLASMDKPSFARTVEEQQQQQASSGQRPPSATAAAPPAAVAAAAAVPARSIKPVVQSKLRRQQLAAPKETPAAAPEAAAAESSLPGSRSAAPGVDLKELQEAAALVAAAATRPSRQQVHAAKAAPMLVLGGSRGKGRSSRHASLLAALNNPDSAAAAAAFAGRSIRGGSSTAAAAAAGGRGLGLATAATTATKRSPKQYKKSSALARAIAAARNNSTEASNVQSPDADASHDAHDAMDSLPLKDRLALMGAAAGKAVQTVPSRAPEPAIRAVQAVTPQVESASQVSTGSWASEDGVPRQARLARIVSIMNSQRHQLSPQEQQQRRQRQQQAADLTTSALRGFKSMLAQVPEEAVQPAAAAAAAREQAPLKQLPAAAVASAAVPAATAAAAVPAAALILDDDFAELEKAMAVRQQQQQRPRLGLGLGLRAAAPRPARQAVMLQGSVGGAYGRLVGRAAPLHPVLRLGDVQREILQWELSELLQQEKGGQGARRPQQQQQQRPSGVATSFNGIEDYTHTFKGLLLAELRASVRASLEEVAAGANQLVSFAAKVDQMQKVDDAQVVMLRAHQPAPAGSQVQQPRPGGAAAATQLPPGDQEAMWAAMRADDLVLLTRRAVGNAANLLERAPSVRCLALVTEVVAERSSRAFQLRLYPDVAGPKFQEALLPRSEWVMTRLHPLVTHFREIQALCSLATLADGGLRSLLLQPSRQPKPAMPRRLEHIAAVPEPLQQALLESYNPSQRAAVAAALGGASSVALVQGPPGTGKTSAILGIASALLVVCAKEQNNQQKQEASEAAAAAEAAQLQRYKQPSVARARQQQRQQQAKAAEEAAAAAAAAEAAEGSDAWAARNLPVPPSRILICAQSNAAVDELVVRILQKGVWGSAGSLRVPALVRLGRSEAALAAAKQAHVDAIAARRAGGTSGSHKAAQAVAAIEQQQRELRQRLGVLKEELSQLQKQQQEGDAGDPDSLQQQQQAAGAAGGGASANMAAEGQSTRQPGPQDWQLRKEMREVCQQLDRNNQELRQGQREVERQQRELRQAVVLAAEITVCTLSAAGGELVSGWPSGQAPRFDALIVDEAAQAQELATLIPMQLLKPGAQVVLVGDPQQLPPTVLTQAPAAAQLSQSLFERLQRAGCPVTVLNEQYRMHPEISSFPSQFFYAGKLKDGISAAARTASFHQRPLLGPLAVLDCTAGQEQRGGGSGGGGGSVHNPAEAKLAAALYRGLKAMYPSFQGTVAVLSPYRAQLTALRRAFDLVTEEERQQVDFQTVDGYQGREADIVIFSAVRAHTAYALPQGNGSGSGNGSRGPSIGFLQDVRRINVALTRARLSLWVVCSAGTLLQSGSLPWCQLLRSAADRRVLFRPPVDAYLSGNRTHGKPGGRAMQEVLGKGVHQLGEMLLSWDKLQGKQGAAPAAAAGAGIEAGAAAAAGMEAAVAAGREMRKAGLSVSGANAARAAARKEAKGEEAAARPGLGTGQAPRAAGQAVRSASASGRMGAQGTVQGAALGSSTEAQALREVAAGRPVAGAGAAAPAETMPAAGSKPALPMPGPTGEAAAVAATPAREAGGAATEAAAKATSASTSTVVASAQAAAAKVPGLSSGSGFKREGAAGDAEPQQKRARSEAPKRPMQDTLPSQQPKQRHVDSKHAMQAPPMQEEAQRKKRRQDDAPAAPVTDAPCVASQGVQSALSAANASASAARAEPAPPMASEYQVTVLGSFKQHATSLASLPAKVVKMPPKGASLPAKPAMAPSSVVSAASTVMAAPPKVAKLAPKVPPAPVAAAAPRSKGEASLEAGAAAAARPETTAVATAAAAPGLSKPHGASAQLPAASPSGPRVPYMVLPRPKASMDVKESTHAPPHQPPANKVDAGTPTATEQQKQKQHKGHRDAHHKVGDRDADRGGSKHGKSDHDVLPRGRQGDRGPSPGRWQMDKGDDSPHANPVHQSGRDIGKVHDRDDRGSNGGLSGGSKDDGYTRGGHGDRGSNDAGRGHSSRSGDRDRGKDRGKDRGREGDGGRGRDKNRGRELERDRGRDRDIGRDRDMDRGRDEDRDKGRDRDKDRDRGRGRDRDKDKDRDRDMGRDKDRDKDKDRDRGRAETMRGTDRGTWRREGVRT